MMRKALVSLSFRMKQSARLLRRAPLVCGLTPVPLLSQMLFRDGHFPWPIVALRKHHLNPRDDKNRRASRE
jgi:hypothetical protein